MSRGPSEEFVARVRAAYAGGASMVEAAQALGVSRKVLQRLRRLGLAEPLPGSAERARLEGARRAAHARCDYEARMAALRPLIAADGTVYGAVAALGWDARCVRRVAAAMGVTMPEGQPRPSGFKAKPKAPAAERRALSAPAQKPAAPQAKKQASRGPSPFGLVGTLRRRPVPPPPDADRLVAEAIAAGRVTRCPPAAPVSNPNNAGMGWR